MLKKSLVLATLAALVLAVVALGGAAIAQNPPVSPSPVKRTIVGKSEVPGSNYEVISAIVEIAPGFKAGRHFHPGNVFGQVLEGEFWLAVDGQPEKIIAAGQPIDLQNKVVHNEGATDKGVKLIAVYVVEKGQPLVNPVK